VAVKERDSMDTTRPLTIDPELARRLKAAAAAGQAVPVTIDDHTYQLSISPEPERRLWADYDPEGVRAAVRRSPALGSHAEPDGLAPLIAEIRVQRDQAPSDFTS
jgi:hypothetical protein